jgi:hypothetical protein
LTEFEYQPWKKVVIHEIIRYSLQHFISKSSLGVSEGGVGRPLMWVDGLVLEIIIFRDTDDIIKEKLDGTIHYSAVTYAVQEKFQPEFKVSGNIRIPVIDVSSNKIFREMVSWIKKNFDIKPE